MYIFSAKVYLYIVITKVYILLNNRMALEKVWIGVFAANSNALHILAMLISNLSSIGINWASKRRLLVGVVRNAPNASLKAEW